MAGCKPVPRAVVEKSDKRNQVLDGHLARATGSRTPSGDPFDYTLRDAISITPSPVTFYSRRGKWLGGNVRRREVRDSPNALCLMLILQTKPSGWYSDSIVPSSDATHRPINCLPKPTLDGRSTVGQPNSFPVNAICRLPFQRHSTRT
jgi:hypothetical protein